MIQSYRICNLSVTYSFSIYESIIFEQWEISVLNKYCAERREDIWTVMKKGSNYIGKCNDILTGGQKL